MAMKKPPARRARKETRRAGVPGSVGIRELKARASAIVAEVREDRARYEITRRGQVEAILVPADPDGATSEAAGDEAWRAFEFLADQLAGASETGATASAVDELAAMRR